MHAYALEERTAPSVTMRESWTDYVRRVTAGMDRKDIAAAAGINRSAVSRWLSGDRPSPEKVISFARGLHQSPLEALVAAGYLADTDIGGAVEIVQSLAALSDDALLEELRGRLRDRLVRSGHDPQWPPPQWRRPDDPWVDEHMPRPQQG